MRSEYILKYVKLKIKILVCEIFEQLINKNLTQEQKLNDFFTFWKKIKANEFFKNI